jgi:hypothetical protein
MQSVRSEYNEKLVRTKLIKEIQTGDRKWLDIILN